MDDEVDSGSKPKKPRQRREQQRALETRERIIQAAIAEFGAHGYNGVSTRAVAERAGAQHTLVTYHFDGKEGLWRTALDRLVRTFTQAQKERLEALRGVDDRIKLKLILTDFVHYSAKNLDLHRFMSHSASDYTPQLDTMVEEYLKEYFDTVAELIRSVQKEDGFISGNPYHLHYLFIGASTRIFMLSGEVERITGSSPFDPKFLESHVNLCLSIFFKTTHQMSPGDP